MIRISTEKIGLLWFIEGQPVEASLTTGPGRVMAVEDDLVLSTGPSITVTPKDGARIWVQWEISSPGIYGMVQEIKGSVIVDRRAQICPRPDFVDEVVTLKPAFVVG